LPGVGDAGEILAMIVWAVDTGTDG
jgi:hypothetical protein